MFGSDNRIVLTVYVRGQTLRSSRAIEAIRRICDPDQAPEFQIKIVDILDDPEEGRRRNILATPTVIRDMPGPERRIIGDLSDRDKVLAALQIIDPAGISPPEC